MKLRSLEIQYLKNLLVHSNVFVFALLSLSVSLLFVPDIYNWVIKQLVLLNKVKEYKPFANAIYQSMLFLKQFPMLFYLGYIVFSLIVLGYVIYYLYKTQYKDKRFESIKKLSQMIAMSPDDFEEYSAYLLGKIYKRKGIRVGHGAKFQIKRIGSYGDGGIDVVLQKAFRKDIYVQCKRYSSNKINVDEIRKMISVAAEYKIKQCIIVSTSDFTKEAKNVAKQTRVTTIKLINGEMLERYAKRG